MSPLPTSIPRATGAQEFYKEPLAFLERSRASLGEIFVIRDDGPIFSRAAGCNGVISLFGAANVQAVLSDIDRFGMPLSARKTFPCRPL